MGSKVRFKPHHQVATFGSCFAQHIGRALKKRGFSWLDTEPAPSGLFEENKSKFGYGIFSCRTGNIYTASLLKQWVEWSLDLTDPPDEYWLKDGRYYDPFRPNIEPDGFLSLDEMFSSRFQAIKSFRKVIEEADVFVFTLGLTESWFNKEFGYEYPMCPGTVAGSYDPRQHVFINQNFETIRRNLSNTFELMQSLNKSLKFILTVSPVPLTATNSQKHVLVATIESKSILRSVAGQLARNRTFIDYFPSYEIINSAPFKGAFFEPNQRSVNPVGVDFVMNNFFDSLYKKYGYAEIENNINKSDPQEDSAVVCEEELLAAFGGEG